MKNAKTGEERIIQSMIGCAIVVEDENTFSEEYHKALFEGFAKTGIDPKRSVMCSNEILALTNGSYDIHEHLVTALAPHISKINIFYTRFNSKQIKEIIVYGKVKPRTISIEEFYSKHLINCFPHICLWKIYSFVKGANATVHIDHFDSEITNAWEIVKKHEKIHCYTMGDMTNTYISFADIVCKLIQKRLTDKDLYLRIENMYKTLPEIAREKKFIHWINNKHLSRITMIHTNKVILTPIMQHPVFYIYTSPDTGMDHKTILFSSPKFLNYVHKKGGCVKFYTAQDIPFMKTGDYVAYVAEKHRAIIESVKTMIKSQYGVDINVGPIHVFACEPSAEHTNKAESILKKP
jgi:hypothetical protein